MDEGHSFDGGDRSVKEGALEDPDADDPDDGDSEDQAHGQGNRDGGRCAGRVHVDAFDDHQVVVG